MIEINNKDADEIANYFRDEIRHIIEEQSDTFKNNMLFENNMLNDEQVKTLEKLEQFTGIKYTDFLKEEFESKQNKISKLQHFIMLLMMGSENGEQPGK